MLHLYGNGIGADASSLVQRALRALPRRHRQRTVAALQRLALARVVFGAGHARWTAGGGALADEPYGHGVLRYVHSRTPGAPMRPLLAEARYLLPALAPAAVAARHDALALGHGAAAAEIYGAGH